MLILNVFKMMLMFVGDVGAGKMTLMGMGAVLRPIARDLNRILESALGKGADFDFKLVHVCLVGILMALVLVRNAVVTPQTYLLERKAKRE